MEGMDRGANSGVFFLPDEKFDFDVSLSPASSRGDEDEDDVFVDQEKRVSVNVASRLEIGGGGGGVQASWSPLTGDQLEAMCQEAHRVADQLQNSEPSPPHVPDDRTAANVITDSTTNREQFVQDADAKLDLFGQPATALSPVKRQTFCVQDSPMKQLPPAIQRRLQRGSSSTAAPSTRSASSTAASSTRSAPSSRSASSTAASSSRSASTARLSTSSSEAKPRTALRGKAVLGVGVVLPSKLAVPSTSCSGNKSRVERTRLQPPSKVAAAAGGRRSPSSRPSSRAGSYEDLLSDSTSVASDVSDSSLNSSTLGKRMLAPPTKRNLSGVKAPPPQSRRVTERKNTSSSSSSSPAAGKLNASLSRRLSSCAGPAPSSVSRPANQNRPRRSTVYAAAEPSAAAGRRSLSTQARKPSEADRSTPLKRAEATPLQPTPARRVSERSASIPAPASARRQSVLKALAPPTPSGGVRAVRHGDGILSPDVSETLKPKRLMSASGVDSLPQKPAGLLTPSAGACRSLQVKARRPSALPTPLRRRMSAIPLATPTNQTRPARPPPTSDSDSASASSASSCSPAPPDTQEAEPVDAPDIQPFCLEEEEEPPAAPPPAAPQPDQSESTDTGELSQSQSEPSRNLIELETTEEKKNQEVLLVDLPPPALQPQEKLLIDLTNTPDPLRTSNKTCTTTQLIDLSSPLIKWSPEDKKENNNNALLINLSF
ncbi:G2 and S phase-expressed protein 1 isoform X2 [Thunnus maccoyii]|uniref:G2 and S phase-expressed protein 1 isoform X2 n=1 Tax=Thunnus maccoyii TaxID=8240 RepID=UPI001C4B74CF|nr:G2 and S phase-expressed protein 1 isoform X2 [Thunnus maccoyii]